MIVTLYVWVLFWCLPPAISDLCFLVEHLWKLYMTLSSSTIGEKQVCGWLLSSLLHQCYTRSNGISLSSEWCDWAAISVLTTEQQQSFAIGVACCVDIRCACDMLKQFWVMGWKWECCIGISQNGGHIMPLMSFVMLYSMAKKSSFTYVSNISFGV